MKVWSDCAPRETPQHVMRFPGRASVYEAEDGFTLIELIIVLLVIPMLIFGVTAAIIASLQNQKHRVTNRLSDTADASIASAYFRRDVQERPLR